MDWAQLLVIILAVLFAIFLLLAIMLAVLLVSISRQIKAATASAERTMHAIEGSVATFNKAALPLALGRGILDQLMKKKPTKKAKKPAHEKE